MLAVFPGGLEPEALRTEGQRLICSPPGLSVLVKVKVKVKR
jgi:hypothetical protein